MCWQINRNSIKRFSKSVTKESKVKVFDIKKIINFETLILFSFHINLIFHIFIIEKSVSLTPI